MLKDESPMSRFEECGKATSLYDLLALIIGGKDSRAKADGVIRECVAPYGAAAPALSTADWRDFDCRRLNENGGNQSRCRDRAWVASGPCT